MIVGVIGPSKLSGKENLKNYNKLAKILAKNEIIISPDKKSTAELFTKYYKENKGHKILGIDYKNDTDNGYIGLDREMCDELIDCNSWENQPKELVKRSKHLIVLGLSVGVTWEICLTKFYWPDPKSRVFVIKELCKDKFPRYLEKSLPIEYISIKNLKLRIA